MASRAEALRALGRVPAAAWVAVVVAASFAVRAWLATRVPVPTTMVDELIYSELAKSFASSGEFLVHDLPTRGYGVVYPVLISPAYALFDDVPTAYAAVKAINAALMSTAAVPAFLIARRMLAPAWALLAAVLAVALPSLSYTTMVLTENAFYPLFLCAAWGLVRALEEPGLSRSVVLWAFVAAAFATRSQAVVLLPAILMAPLVLALFDRRAVRRYVPLYATSAVVAVVAVAVAAVSGRSPSDLLGAYEIVSQGSYEPGRVAKFWLWHVAELALYVGVAPVAATLLLLSGVSRRTLAVQAFLATTLALTLWTSLAVAAFASRFVDRIQERNLFVVAPLLLIATLAWIAVAGERRRAVMAAAVAAAVALPLLLPYGRFVESAGGDALALLALQSSPASALATAAVGAVLAGALVAFAPRAALIGVVAYFIAVNGIVSFGGRGFERTAERAQAVAFGDAPRSWIDDAVPDGATVAAIWTGRLHPLTIQESQFFNRSVGPVYRTGEPSPGSTNEIALSVARTGAIRRDDGQPVRERYVLVDDAGTITPAGTEVAHARGAGLTLWKVDPPLVTLTTVEGLYEGSTWSAPTVTYARRRCPGGTLAVTVASDPALFDEPTRVATVSGGVRDVAVFSPNDVTVLRIPLVVEDGRCVVQFTVSPTAVPAEVLPGSTDRRRLGAHFRAFLLEP